MPCAVAALPDLPALALAVSPAGPAGVRRFQEAGLVAIAGLQMQLVIERSARLARRAPRVRFALSAPVALSVDVLRRGRRPAIHVSAAGRSGPNIVKIPARKLRRLREGRYTVRVTARGSSGVAAVQELPLAIVPPLH